MLVELARFFFFLLPVLLILVSEKPPWGVDNKICIVLYCSADKIKFLEQNNCLLRSIKLHDAGWRFQLVVRSSVRLY